MAKNISETNTLKLFGKWDFTEVVVEDIGLQNYINLNPILVPKTNGYYHNTPFYKTKVNIVERLATRLQVAGHKGKEHFISSGHNTGKSGRITRMIEEVLSAIEKRTKQNPIQVLVSAIVNAAPREEVITIERSGARYAQAVDMSPQRRIDLVLRYLAQGAAHKSFNSETSLKDTLTEEILDCYHKGGKSMAMSKKHEIERMAAAAK